MGTITVERWSEGRTGEYIGRGMPTLGIPESPLANLYRVGKDGSRDDVIMMFQSDLRLLLQRAEDGMDLSEAQQERIAELERLTELAREGDLVLLCWCAPKACHGDVIREIIMERLAGGAG